MTHSGIIVGLPKDRPDELERIEEFIFSDKNYLDHVVLDPLYITPKKDSIGHRNFYSTFDLEYEQYGYECYNQYDGSAITEIRWKNDNINMTFDKAHDFANRMNDKIKKSNKFKFGGFAFPYYKSLGVAVSDLMTMSKHQILQKYNIKELTDNKKQEYKQLLLNKI